MRTTLNIDQDLLQEAGRLTGLKEKTALVRLGLQAHQMTTEQLVRLFFLSYNPDIPAPDGDTIKKTAGS
jgi:hypothetical protein